MISTFVCLDCQKTFTHDNGGCGSTGYAMRDRNDPESTVCFDCCAREDIAYMRKEGRISLYLIVPDQRPFASGYTGSSPATSRTPSSGKWTLNNWPGTLSFQVKARSFGSHNWAGRRYDVWFCGPDGYVWHGVQYGDNTQLCHCRRTKELWGSSVALDFKGVLVPYTKYTEPTAEAA